MRSGLRAERGAQSAAEYCAFQFVWVRRDQWVADLQKVDGVRFSPLIYTDHTDRADLHAGPALQSTTVELMSLFRRQLSTFGLLLWTTLSVSAAPATKWSAQWEPTKLVNGSPVLFRVTAPLQLTELTGKFSGTGILISLQHGMPLLVWICRRKPGDQAGHIHIARRGQKPDGKEAAMSYAVRSRGSALSLPARSKSRPLLWSHPRKRSQ